MIQEPLDKEKYENRRFNNRSARKSLRRLLGNSKFTPQKTTERPKIGLAERDEISKDSLKKRIRASKNMMSHLGQRIQERFVKTATKFPRLCGRRKNDDRLGEEAPCPCVRYVKVSRNHSLAATNDSTTDLHKQLKSTGHLSKNWQEPDSRPTSVDVRKIDHSFSTNRTLSCKSYQYVSYLDGNVHIEPLTNNVICKYGEGIDEIHSRPREKKSIRDLFKSWR